MENSTALPLLLKDYVAGKKLVFFDCDGVLLDSNRIKLAAVDHALNQLEEEVRGQCLASFKMNFGRPRQWHFEAFYRLAGPTSMAADDFVRHSIQRYEAYLHDNYLLSPVVAGAAQLLAGLVAQGTVCMVISGGKENEIRAVLHQTGMTRYFAQIVGSPVAKTQAMQAFLAQYQCQPASALFFGDAVADAEAAIACQVPFLFVSQHALVQSAVIREQWPAQLWGGEITNLMPENFIAPFSRVSGHTKGDQVNESHR